MRRGDKVRGRGLAFLFPAGMTIGPLSPIKPADWKVSINYAIFIDNLEVKSLESELNYSDIQPDMHKRIVRAGAADVQTPLSVFDIHGLAANSEDTRPAPDLVAQALGANLFYTPIGGHARSTDAMSPGQTAQTAEIIIAWARGL